MLAHVLTTWLHTDPAFLLSKPSSTFKVDKKKKIHSVPANPGFLDPNKLVDPLSVIADLEAGWKTYISLVPLMNAWCRASANTRRSANKSLVFNPSGSLTVEADHVDMVADYKMTQSEWLEAITRLADMIEKYLPTNSAAVANQWRLYKSMMTAHSNFTSEFSSHLAYDIHIHKAYYQFSNEFLPSKFQIDVWNTIKDQE
jgi:hypothetical protein